MKPFETSPVSGSESLPERTFLHNIEIADLEKPTEEILMRIRRRVDAGEYKLIIGDDASGRIPTLVFNKVLGALYQAQGIEKPKTVFVAGSGHLDDEYEKRQKTDLLRERFQKMSVEFARIKESNGKILVVTDLIVTGKSLKPLTDILMEMGVSYEIASIAGEQEHRDALQKFLGGRLIFGMNGMPGIYDTRHLGGVWKDKHELHSHARAVDLPEQAQLAAAHDVEVARKDVALLSNKLIAWYAQRVGGRSQKKVA